MRGLVTTSFFALMTTAAFAQGQAMSPPGNVNAAVTPPGDDQVIAALHQQLTGLTALENYYYNQMLAAQREAQVAREQVRAQAEQLKKLSGEPSRVPPPTIAPRSGAARP